MKEIRNVFAKYSFIVPAVIFMLVLIGYPLVYNIVLSFQKVDLSSLTTGETSFIGLYNYKKLFGTEVFGISVLNTIIYTIGSVVFQVVIGFLLALFFSMKFKLASFLRGLVMISWLIPLTVSALLFKFMMSDSVGVINEMLLYLNFIESPIQWLSNPDIALWSVIIANIWVGIPFNMLLLSTGISNLPTEVFEASALDGANWIKRTFYITLPMLKPVILVVLMLGFIYTFKVFDLVYVMTGGGPINSTEVLSTVAYKFSFEDFNFSLGSATANILFVILFLISLIYLRMMKDDEVL